MSGTETDPGVTVRRPLTDVRVLDLTRQLAGAGATRILGILGAEILRIEWPHPPGLDFLRLSGTSSDGRPSLNRSPSFAQINVEKKSIAINASTDRGRDILKQLLPLCDVVAESFTAGVLERWGFGYETMTKIKPDIIYLAASGWGHTGPLRDYKSNGPAAQAYGGLTAMCGLPDREPAGWGFSYMDHMGATMNAVAIVMALLKRKLTGRGDSIDTGQTQNAVALLGPMLLDAAINGAQIRPAGNRDLYRNYSPNNAYRCRGVDSWIALSVRTKDEWNALCRVMDLSELAARPELELLESRIAAEDEIDARISAWTATRDRYDVMQQLQAAGVPAGAVQHVDDKCLRDPQLAHRGFYQMVADDILGTRRYEAAPLKLDAYDTNICTPRPLMGEHTREVLADLLEFSPQTIDTLIEDEIIFAAPAVRQEAMV